MVKVSTNSPIDKILDGGIESDTVTNIYGPAGSGKTNIALAAAINCSKEKKILYIDTEGSFSYERFKQMGGTENNLKNFIFLEVHDWNGQHMHVQKLEDIVKKEDIGLIVIDSLVALYRLVLDEKSFQKINNQLAMQYSILSKIARTSNIPVIVTNQVYSTSDGIELTSRTIARYWSKTLIELKKLDQPNCRLAILKKHRSLSEERKVEFEITGNGFKETGKFKLF